MLRIVRGIKLQAVVVAMVAMVAMMMMIIMLLPINVFAQVTTTSVIDTIHNFDNTLFSGNLTITGPSFNAPGNIPVIASTKTYRVNNGALSIKLIPNDTATPPGTTYSLTFSNGVQKTCNVPTSVSPVTLNGANCVDGSPAVTLSPVLLQQLDDGGATTGQPLCWLGTQWGPGSCGGGGGGGSGITTLNGLTPITQAFATGTTGSNFTITSSGSTHTFNLPSASASNRGLLTSADWTVFNSKQPVITGAPGSWPTFTAFATLSTGASSTVVLGNATKVTLDTSIVPESGNLYFTNSRAVTALSGLYQTPITTGTADQVINGTLGLKSLVDCVSTGGVYQYSTSTHAFTCHVLLAADIPNIAESQVTSLVSDLSGKQATITGAPGAWPSTFIPTAHASTHASAGSDPVTLAESQITNLTSDLAAKAPTNNPTFTGTAGFSNATCSGTCTGFASGGGGATRLAGAATFAFGSAICDGCCAQSGTTITVTGANAGDAIAIGATPALSTGISVTGKATAGGTVTVEVCNWSGASVTPSSTTYQALTVH